MYINNLLSAHIRIFNTFFEKQLENEEDEQGHWKKLRNMRVCSFLFDFTVYMYNEFHPISYLPHSIDYT